MRWRNLNRVQLFNYDLFVLVLFYVFHVLSCSMFPWFCSFLVVSEANLEESCVTEV